MKFNMTFLALSSLLMVSSCYAQENTNDVSASLNITGVVTSASSACGVSLSQNSINVTENMDYVINQGDKNYSGAGAFIHVYFSGGAECESLALDGKLVYHFSGTADNADGTVLANNDVSSAGAKGLGMGIFDKDHNVIELNKGTLVASPTGIDVFNLSIVKLTGQEVVPGTLQSALTIDIERL